MILESITIPPTKAPVGTVIWLHGLGANGRNFINILPQLALPQDLYLRFIFPNAPIRPVKINTKTKMRAWYDIYSLTNLTTREDEAGIVQSQKSLNKLIEEEISRGIPSDRIVIAGFSQGGAMALYTSLQFTKPLAGVIALSTYLPLSKQFETKVNIINHQIPIFMAHGDLDSVVPFTLGKQTFKLLNHLGYSIEWHEYSMDHQVCHEEIQTIGKWLTHHFSQTL